jgi:S1-C subfamily serine protease
MIADARDVGASSGATAATRTLARDLFTQATLALKIGFPLLVLAIAVPLAFVGGWLGAQPSREDVRQADRVTASELSRLRAQQRQQADELARLAQGAGLVREIQERWSQGVCLVHGIFGIKKADGILVTDAAGVPFEIEYTGSGFLADADGSVVTNGHVVAPWEEMDETTAILLGGGKPAFTHLTATFPGLAPIDVDPGSIRRRADHRDVAVFRLLPESLKGVPVLPRHQDDLQDLADHRAIVVGYPTGLAALLAQADSDLVAALQSEGATITIAIQRLAAKGSIHPTLTQGVFALTKPDLLTYDAMTTHGGSGGPVFGADGKVIGVNFAIQPGFSGANYGVPIAFANELLAKPH